MTTFKYIYALAIGGMLFASCGQKNSIKEITCEQVTINAALDSLANPELQAIVDSYKIQIDSVMNQQIGVASQTLTAGKPQSLLANFTSDILIQAGREFTGKPVQFAVMNNGGLRAPINAGPITVGDIFKVFPFENELVVLELEGKDVKELFKRLAAIGGEGLGGCELVIKDNKVESLRIAGKPVDDEQTYWMATIDYLADGNSGMSVLEDAEERINTGVRLRDVMIQYIQQLTAQGKEVNSAFDNRINVLP